MPCKLQHKLHLVLEYQTTGSRNIVSRICNGVKQAQPDRSAHYEGAVATWQCTSAPPQHARAVVALRQPCSQHELAHIQIPVKKLGSSISRLLRRARWRTLKKPLRRCERLQLLTIRNVGHWQ